MKKSISIIKKQLSTLALGCALVALAAPTLVNCTNPIAPTTFTVIFNTNGGTPKVESKIVEIGKTLAKPTPDPTKTDSIFVGWYKDKALTQAFNFATEKITANITLYAKWEHPTRVTIPDVHFRAKLKALIPNAFVGDELNTASLDITARRYLNVSASGTDSIKDLTGIRYFTTLTDLYCRDNQLTTLDVSKNTALTRLYCDGNNLAVLDVSKNTALRELECSNNNLTDLNVSNNAALIVLYCRENSLAGLDVSNNTALSLLDCSNNDLTGLDMRGMRSVTSLSIHAVTRVTNVIGTLKVHESLKDHAQISAVKTARGDEVTISTYSAAAGSSSYTLECSNYDPNADDGSGGKGVCKP